MNDSARLLIVDDEEDLCEILQFNLESEGYHADTASSAEEALDMMSSRKYALVLLDVMMDGMSGFRMAEVLRVDRQSGVPIIFLTAKDTEGDILKGFSVGGDDYISKPFSIKEVLARVKAILRRQALSESPSVPLRMTSGTQLQFDGLKVDLLSLKVFVEGEEVVLTRKEFDILSLLMRDPDRCHPRAEILNKIWTEEVYVLERTVDVHIARLRKKIGVYGKRIVNRSTFGYMFSSQHSVHEV